jgi:3-methyladenine DNA glycosylase/8-oxoguanine DNA glycosylase
MGRMMAHELPLVGPAGEPVDFRRLIQGHGVSELPPLRVDANGQTFSATLPVSGRAPVTAIVRQTRPGFIAIETNTVELSRVQRDAVVRSVRHILRLDENLSPFYALAASDPELRWATAGAGRMTRCLTVFEDVVKTILTTNCAWSATVRMTHALVDKVGVPVETLSADGTFLKAFPTPDVMAAQEESFYRETIKAGYRAKYLKELAQIVAAGEVDLEALGHASVEELPDNELAKQLQALPGVGPYAAAHIMMMLGRYSRCIFDSWTRPAYAARHGLERVADAEIAARFAPYGRFAGLAFWLFITEPWLETTQPTAS